MAARYWKVRFSNKAAKQACKLPQHIRDSLLTLATDMELSGPMQPSWRNFSKMRNKRGEYYHCHLNGGKPRYVAIWTVADNTVRIIEVIYAGSHENADYRRLD
ncbi:type II toxin-antitoxin system RelE family toxin [Desulfovibrio sp. SGI.169]|uniref:type II toxin-antitoxin system RelE family toxin n=1 Tax=Desulfovibrio sp. SGI.169 TaxID=3420561 RepID=UPI003D00BF25